MVIKDEELGKDISASIGAESTGFYGKTRNVTLTGSFTGDEYLLYQVVMGEGKDAITWTNGGNISIGQTEFPIIYRGNQEAKSIVVRIMSGTPDFSNPLDIGVTTYKSASSTN